MGRERTGDRLTGVNLLELTPVRQATWRQVGQRVVVERPRPRDGSFGLLLRRLAYYMAPPRLRLDEIGSFAWQRFDGNSTVAEVAEAMRERFGSSAEPAEQRLGEFVRLLHRERLLRYEGYEA